MHPINQAVFQVLERAPKRIRELRCAALFDLYYGPMPRSYWQSEGINRYPGQLKAAKLVGEWLAKQDWPKLWDANAECFVSEEDAEHIGFEDIYEVTYEDAVRVALHDLARVA